MKLKPTKHRTSNTFRFQGFNDRIKEIKVSSLDFILKKDETDKEDMTIFWQTLLKWKELNLTLGFKEFQRDIGSECQSIPQLLLKEKHIAETIENQLLKVDNLALPPILHLLVAFAHDIPDIFYKNYFYIFIKRFLDILKTKNLETIEHIFICIISLFTLLQKYLKNDIVKLFINYEFCTLFSKKFPWYINDMASKSIASIIRKSDNKKEIFIIILRKLNKKDYEADSLARLLFHCLKSDIITRLHSSATNIFSLLLEILKEKDVPLEKTTETLSCSLKYIAEYVTSSKQDLIENWQDNWKKDNLCIWPSLLKNLENFDPTRILSSEETLLLNSYLKLINTLVQYKQGILVIDEKNILKNILKMTQFYKEDCIGQSISEICANIILSSYGDKVEVYRYIADHIFSSKYSYSIIFEFIKNILKADNFDKDIFPFALNYILKIARSVNDLECKRVAIIDLFATIIYGKQAAIRTGDELLKIAKYNFDFSQFEDVKSNEIDEIFYSIVKKELTDDLNGIDTLTITCYCLPNICSPRPEILMHLLGILNKCFVLLEGKPEIYIKDLDTSDPAKTSPKKKKRKSKVIPTACPDFDFNIKPNFSNNALKILNLVSVIVESLYYLMSPYKFVTTLIDAGLISFLKENLQFRECSALLRSVDIVLTVASMENHSIISEDTLNSLYKILAPCLSSNQHIIRLIVSHIFSLFSYNTIGEKNMFSIMFEVELMPLSPHNFKERLRILSQLDSDCLDQFRSSGIYDQAPLLFLIGQFFINFKDIWSPIMQHISKYAYSMEHTEFWSIWLAKLKLASFLCMDNLSFHNEDNIFDNFLLQNIYNTNLTTPLTEHLNERSDYLNFRNLMWQSMQHFTDVCERRHRDIVSLFFEFLYKEFLPTDFNVAPSQDISIYTDKHSEDEMELDKSELSTLVSGNSNADLVNSNADLVNSNADLKNSSADLENSSADFENSSADLENSNVDFGNSNNDLGNELNENNQTKKSFTKTLCEMINVFAKFHNPKAIYKTKELEEIYCEFLSHPYLKLQKISLDALFTYNYAYLTPYKETLYNILDDKTFRNEITLFKIDGDGEDESKSLKQDHRKDFMPILMRILYGKMHYKTGSHTAGKAKTRIRKGIVLRFLAGANESELDTFLNLSFDVFIDHLEGTLLDIVERIDQNLDPKKVVPLKRMLGALGTLETVFDKLGALLEEKTSFMLKVIVFILGTTVNLLERKEAICSHFTASLKSLRHLALQKIVTFFSNYDNYAWTADELEAIFKVAVWPSLVRLPDEGIYSPTPLLRLFTCWADNPKYHILLAKYDQVDAHLTTFPYIIKLINHPKCSSAVVDAVYGIIERLLFKKQYIDDDKMEDDNDIILTCKNILNFNEAKTHGLKELTIGQNIIWHNLNGVIKNMKNKLINLKNGQMVNERDLTILIQLSNWIKDQETGQDLLEFIIPLLKKNCIKQNEKVAYLLDTCTSLVKMIENPENYIKDLLNMFSTINGRNARLSLCNTIEAIAYKNDNFKTLSKWCMELNSWNAKMVEEIDHETRLKCYKEIAKYLKTIDYIESHLSCFLIFHNVWVLLEIDDQGLKNLASSCLQNVIEMLVRLRPNDNVASKKMIELTLLPQLKRGFRTKKDNAWNSFVNIFCIAVHKCYNFISKLKDLMPISNLEDPDTDFLTNISHIQISRRTRAMNRLADQMIKSSEDDDESSTKVLKFHTNTITEFLLPIVSHFLFKEEYSNEDNLVNASIRCIGALANQLPWHPYQNLLLYYLNVFKKELKHLKVGVKALEAVINAFHEEVRDPSETNSTSQDADVNYSISEDAKDLSDIEEFDEQLSDVKKIKSEKIFIVLSKVLIPQIQRTLSLRSQRDTEHKVNKKKYPEDEDIKRIPLALALIKLFKKLPQKVLKLNANSVLLKLIQYIKSKSLSVRREARSMLVKVMEELGGDYLACLVEDLNSILVRGYQAHVMVFTVHSVLTNLQSDLKPCHIDPCLKEIIDMCIDDLFGEKSEEKEVKKITAKTSEARAEKGYSIMAICAQVISEDNLENMMLPMKELLKTNNKKVVNKVVCCLRKIANGIVRNENIKCEHKSLLIYGILTEKIDALFKESMPTDNNKIKSKQQTTDSYLIAPEPRRAGIVSKTSKKATSYALVEFALNLLYTLIKEGHFKADNMNHCGLLDVYVSLMNDYIKSEYPEISVYAVNIILGLLKFPLPSLKMFVSKISQQIFVILNKYATSGLKKGKLFELVQLCFRTIAYIIKHLNYYTLEQEHIKVLIYYARNNLDDHNQHHSTFTLLDAMISRKIHATELHELMVVLKKLSVISSNTNMLNHARSTYIKYMLKYRKKSKQNMSSLMFFLNNVSFEVLQGRMSASLLIHEVICKYPKSVFNKNTEINVWFKLTEQLVKEDSKEHRLLLKKCLKELYKQSVRKNVLITNCLNVMVDNPKKNKAENAIIIYMSAKSLLAFLDNAAADQSPLMITDVIPKMVNLLHPGRYNRIKENDDEQFSEKELHSLDITLDALLEIVMKLMDIYSTENHVHIWTHDVGDDFWTYIQDHLLYSNLKVRLRSAALFGKFFSMFPVDQENIASIVSTSDNVTNLIKDFCEQLNTISPVETHILSELGMAVVRNLIYLISQGKKVPIKMSSDKVLDILNQETDKNINVSDNEFITGAYSVLHRVGELAYNELKNQGKQSILCRQSLLNLIAGIIHLLGDEFKKSSLIVKFIIRHLTRELSDEHLPTSLLNHTKEVTTFVKEQIGADRYNEEMLKVQLSLEKKRNERKARNKERVVSNPHVAMQKKAKKQLAKKISKKRKLVELKLKPNKKRCLRGLAMVAS